MSTTSDNEERGGAPAVTRALRILDYLAHDHPEASLSDIATALELNKSTCFNILKSLTRAGVVVRDSRYPLYRLGPKLVELGRASRRNYSYRGVVTREMSPVVERYRVTCLLAQLLPHQSGIVVTDRILPRRDAGVRVSVGQVYPISVPAMGRAALAALPFARVMGLMQLMSMSDAQHLAELTQQLEQIRQQGFAVSLEEYQEGVNAVATTVHDAGGNIALILCLVGPPDDFPADRVMAAGAELRQKAEHLRLALHESNADQSMDAHATGNPAPFAG